MSGQSASSWKRGWPALALVALTLGAALWPGEQDWIVWLLLPLAYLAGRAADWDADPNDRPSPGGTS